MLFSSMLFIWVFLVAVLCCYYFCLLIPFKNPKNKVIVKNAILLIASFIFYAWGGIYYLLIMIASILVNFFGGHLIETKFKESKYRKLVLIITIALNLGILFFFKYFNMLVTAIESIMALDKGLDVAWNALISMEGTGALQIKKIVLPIGISFFTFQSMSYVIDLYLGKTKEQKNIFDFALYVSLFPQLIAGPIVKYKDIEDQIQNRVETFEDFAYGVKRFCYGLAKKVLISNLFAEIADKIWALETSTLGTAVAWLGIISYTIQIYFDFSGYSDMAIGLGYMFGFKFKENFNYPYTSLSIQEFWRRWHISLSTWFKEYVYIPLGGNRKGKARTYINLFIVFLLTGIWHGANFTFIVWGLYFGLFLILERAFLGEWLKKNPIKILNWLYMIIVVMVGWVFFRAENIFQAIEYLKQMFSFVEYDNSILTYLSMETIYMLVIAIALAGFVQRGLQSKYLKIKDNTVVVITDYVIQIGLLALCVLALIGGTYNPFIYFQF